MLRIFPWASTRMEEGTPVRLYALNADSPGGVLRSSSWPQDKFSSFKAVSQFSRFESMEILTILNPFGWYLSYVFRMWGNSARQGWHHEAQNSIRVTCPGSTKSEIFLLLPSGAISSLSRKGCPMNICLRCIVSRSDFPISDSCKRGESAVNSCSVSCRESDELPLQSSCATCKLITDSGWSLIYFIWASCIFRAFAVVYLARSIALVKSLP